jgi:hypothetical protein
MAGVHPWNLRPRPAVRAQVLAVFRNHDTLEQDHRARRFGVQLAGREGQQKKKATKPFHRDQ